MSKVQFRNVDLNLLIPLKALLHERNVTRAAERIHLSQSAMSRALDRLRSELGDELLVRVGRNYELTPRGSELLDELAQVMPRLARLRDFSRAERGTHPPGNERLCKQYRVGAASGALWTSCTWDHAGGGSVARADSRREQVGDNTPDSKPTVRAVDVSVRASVRRRVPLRFRAQAEAFPDPSDDEGLSELPAYLSRIAAQPAESY